MGFQGYIKKHPSIIGIVIGLCILAFIAFTIITQQK